MPRTSKIPKVKAPSPLRLGRRARGFALIETVLAIALLAAFLGLAAVGLAEAAKLQTRAEEIAETTRLARHAFLECAESIRPEGRSTMKEPQSSPAGLASRFIVSCERESNEGQRTLRVRLLTPEGKEEYRLERDTRLHTP